MLRPAARRAAVCALLLAAGLVAACLNPATQAHLPDVGPVAVADSYPPYDGPTPVHCPAAPDAGTRYVDATERWNLGQGGLKVTGNRLTAGDLDGDGYPDLIVHAITSNARTQLDGGALLVRVLMNRPAPSGQGRIFVDATVESGLFQVRGGSATELRSAQFAVLGDVDNDGDLDVFSGTYTDPTKPATDPGDRSEVMLNDGTGHFTLAPPSAPHPGPLERMPTTSATFTDADRDGRLDLFVGHWYEYYGQTYNGLQAQLFKGNGTGAFTDVTAAAGLTTTPDGFEAGTNHRPAYGVTSCDLNDDGSPELMVSAYGRQWNLLYKNDGHGAFSEQGQTSGYAGDANLDFHDNEFFKCWCTVNAASPKCAGVLPPQVQCPNPAGAGWADGVDDRPWRNNGNTFTTLCADLDGDGKNDLYSAEIHHWWAGAGGDSSELLKNVTTGADLRFQRPGNAATGMVWPHVGLSWNEGGLMAAPGDLDNDGRLDVVVAASDYPDQYGLLFHQLPDGRFEEAGSAFGLHHACVSGLAIADFDRDGDLDVVVGSGTARDCSLSWHTNEVHLYENVGAAPSWLLLRLRGDGTTANRAGIGAKVTVKVDGKSFTREVGGGYGHFGLQNDVVLHLGLGACPAVDSVTVRWPDASGTVQTWQNAFANDFIELRQGDPKLYRALR